MSERFQPGAHPDADQLNAFIEGVLPEHERLESLAHLAACEQCRQIVFLTQQAEEPASAPMSAPFEKRWWFSPLALFGSAAAAFACALLIFIAVRDRHLPEAPSTNQVARVEPPAVPVVTMQQQTQASVRQNASRERSQTSEASAPPAPKAVASSPVPPLVAGSLSGMATGTEAGLPAGDSISLAQAHATNLGAGSGRGTGAEASSIHGEEAFQMQHSRNNAAAEQYSLRSSAMAAPTKQPTAPAVPELPVNGRNIVGSTSKSVQVNAAVPAMDADAATIDGILATSAAKKSSETPTIHTLPSKLPSIAVASKDGRTIAADSNGALFFSKKNRKHWNAVAAQWQGKIATLMLTAPEAAKSAQRFELVTDSGAHWVSDDGLHWQPK